MKKVLIVDDDRRMRRTLQIVIEAMDLESVAAADAREAWGFLEETRFDLVITDLKMPGTTGIELLEQIRQRYPALPVILVTAYGTIQTAIEAMKKGASDYVLKPFDNESLELVIRRAMELERIRSENEFLREQLSESWAAEELFLTIPGMAEVTALIAKVAPTNSPVLIRGETGTGKELAARCIHAQSDRRDRLFVPLNCAALPGELLEAELFGHAKGAFTGADRARKGKFEVADGGTIFLDEIGDMPLPLQAKLLRVLEESVVEPLGTNERISVDVRVVSATNQNLEENIETKEFRSDLYYRINNFEVHLPPLRERPDDVEILANAYLERSARERGKIGVGLSKDAIALLRSYRWPGNVRELRTLAERAAVLATGQEVGADFFAPMIKGPAPIEQEPAPQAREDDLEEGGGLGERVDRFERREILRALDDTGDNKAEAARRLGISERNLWYKLKKHGL